MTTPIIYPPLQPGVCDTDVTYTFTILARNASVITLGTLPALFTVSPLDSVGSISNPPGDMAVRFSFIYKGQIATGTTLSVSIPFTVSDNAGNSVSGSQPIVMRAWTVATGGPTGHGTAIASYSGPWSGATFLWSAHPFSVGDRVFMTYYSGGSPIGANCVVTALVGGGFTVAAYDGTTGSPAASQLYYASYYQLGTAQNDITSAASVSGTRGTALSFTVSAVSGTVGAAGVPAGIGLQGSLLSGTPLQYGWFPVVLTAGTMQRLALFSISPGTWDSLVTAPSVVNVGINLAVAVPVLTPTLAGDTITWTLSGAPNSISLTNTSATGATISGSFTAYGTYPVVVTAVGGTVPLSTTVTFVVSAPAPATPLYLPWLHSNLALTDLQFDVRFRGVTSYYAVSGANNSNAIPLFESDTANLAVVLWQPDPLLGQINVSDATTLWFTARTDVDTKPVIDLQVTGSSALTPVTGGSYYLIPLNLSADAILDAINDLDDPGNGAPAVLTLYCQLAVLRGGNVARSAPFTMTVSERITDAGLPALNQY